jgi:hypothetical protein
MIDIKHKKCEFNGCSIRPSYNNYGEIYGQFCKKHKEPSMIDVTIRQLCESNGCQITPNYNIEGETRGRFCVKHKEQNMVDIANKRL